MRDGLAKEMATHLELLANIFLADVAEELPMLQPEENTGQLKKANVASEVLPPLLALR